MEPFRLMSDLTVISVKCPKCGNPIELTRSSSRRVEMLRQECSSCHESISIVEISRSRNYRTHERPVGLGVSRRR